MINHAVWYVVIVFDAFLLWSVYACCLRDDNYDANHRHPRVSAEYLGDLLILLSFSCYLLSVRAFVCSHVSLRHLDRNCSACKWRGARNVCCSFGFLVLLFVLLVVCLFVRGAMMSVVRDNLANYADMSARTFH